MIKQVKYLCLSCSKHSINVWHYFWKIAICSSFTFYQSICPTCLTAFVSLYQKVLLHHQFIKKNGNKFQGKRVVWGRQRSTVEWRSSPSSVFLLIRCVVWAGHFISLGHCVFICEMSALDFFRSDICDILQLLGARHWPIRTGATTSMVWPCSCELAAVPSCPKHVWSQGPISKSLNDGVHTAPKFCSSYFYNFTKVAYKPAY